MQRGVVKLVFSAPLRHFFAREAPFSMGDLFLLAITCVLCIFLLEESLGILAAFFVGTTATPRAQSSPR